MGKKSRLYNYTKEELQEVLDSTSGLIPALRKLGINGGSSLQTLRRIAFEWHLDLTKNQLNAKYAQQYSAKNSYDLSDILVENSTYTNMERLKIRLVRNNLKVYRCEICGITTWNGEPLSLQLHHKNGKHNDNRLTNLQILCPNCHSQTENYGSRNAKGHN